MTIDQPILILGASARAAAFSAVRAGLKPWCADRFGDADLRALCPSEVLRPADYPEGFAGLLDRAPRAPWLYTGGLENRPELVRRLARIRPLWGNDAAVLARVRAPRFVSALLRSQGLACPEMHWPPADLPGHKRWLVKPRAGAGGAGIRFWPAVPKRASRSKRFYIQEYIEGDACAALYVANGHEARLLGVTYQLIGMSWLHAAPFHYCGSLGPVEPDAELRQALGRLGSVLAEGCGLRGILGVDFILRDGLPWPVEVNPRYTASVELLEHALGFSALALQRAIFDPTPPVLSPAPAVRDPAWIGKAILFAPAPLTFPTDGPWRSTLQSGPDPHQVPLFADIPCAGQPIEAGSPIFTYFARAGSQAACRDSLRRIAADLDQWLFGR